MRSDTCILQFTRSPAAAGIKTRLSSCLDREERIALHCRMTRHVCAAAVAADVGPVQLWVEGALDHPFLHELCGDYPVEVHSQTGADLGERMHAAAQRALERHAAAILIGSDCPFLDAAYLQRAASLLAERDAVLGPALDGGYIMLGLRRVSPLLFARMPWGSDQVFALTEQRLRSHAWSFQSLPPLPDIDRPEDLQCLEVDSLPRCLRCFSKAPT